MNSALELRPQDAAAPDFLSGGGEMGKRIRNFDWSGTLGPFSQWPRSLRTCVRIMLTSRQPFWIGWGKDLIKLYNDPYRAIVGGKHPWSLGQPASLVWKDIWKDIGPMLDQVMKKGEGVYVESQLLIMERNGYPEETYYTFSYSPIPGDQGGTEGMICANTEDTARIIGERQLQTLQYLGNIETKQATLEDVFRAVTSALAKNPKDFPFILVYQVDAQGKEARVVSRSAQVAGFPEQVDLEGDTGDLGRAFRSGRMTLIDRPAGVSLPRGAWGIEASHLLYLPISTAGEAHPRGVLVLALNPFRRFDEAFRLFAKMVGEKVAGEVGEVIAYEQERNRAEALAEIDRAKTAFFSNISHEFRTPLTLFLGPVEDALHDPDTSAANRERLEMAHRNALRLQKLVNSLLDFSRIEAKRMHVDFERVDLGRLTRDIASSFEPVMEKAGLTYLVDCPSLPDRVAVDVDMWENIVLNLVSNAFKYTDEGRVAVRLAEQEGGLALSVEDTGVGIPPEEQSRIFERFHRVEHTRGRTQEGTGIGLSLVKELVKLHQGEVGVVSEPGKGSAFTVFIPFSTAGAPGQGSRAHDPNKRLAFTKEAEKWDPWVPGVAEGRPGLPLLLVADDNADMRAYIERLARGHFRVQVATNGEEAFRAALRERPDLILSDIMMPRVDGFTFLKQVRQNDSTSHIPFIFLSARAGEEARLEGLQAGADDYLVKPFSGKELLVKVEANIRIARTREAAQRDLHHLIMQTPVGIAVYAGPGLVVELVNDTMLAYWGRTREEAMGTPLWDLLPEAKAQGFDRIAAGVYRTGKSYRSPETPVHLERNGKMETIYAHFAFEPRRDEQGRIIGLLGIANDVTAQVLARKEIETVVKERTEALRRSNEDLQQFAHVASHDLKEPVRKVQVFTSRLKDEFNSALPERAAQYIARVEAAAARMSSMIEGVLLYSTLGAAEVRLTQVNLREVIQGIETDLEVVIWERDATLEYRDLPSFRGDSFLIYQLFYNLISNALKFSKQDVSPVIRISTLQSGNGPLCITVEDNGIGFDQVYSETIFKTFSRLNSKDHYEGTGLGLALCRKIVERHHGWISAEGQEGVGAKFTIGLPG